MDGPTLRPIGFLRTTAELKFDRPHQPDPTADETHLVELIDDPRFDLAVQDLEGFERIWLIWWFHRNTTWRPRALPPRGPARRRGVFATRSPHRPNPIGLTCVRLLSVEGRRLWIGPCDLLDGTPILDLKPYLPGVDAFPESRAGWVDELEATLATPAPYRIVRSPEISAQAAWLATAYGIDFLTRAEELLARDPSPHRTRRILAIGEGEFRMACGPWRVWFDVEDRSVHLRRISVGIAEASLRDPAYERLAHREALTAFLAAFVQ